MHGILRPPEADTIPYDGKTNWAAIMLYADKPKPKGRSTLTKYECPHCGLKVRIGIKDDPRLVHDSCSNVKGEKVFLVKHDGLEHTIFESADDDEKPNKVSPTIIDEINENIRKRPLGDLEKFTFERIAAKVGINEKVLSEWLESDPEFTTALERLKDAQKTIPLKQGQKKLLL